MENLTHLTPAACNQTDQLEHLQDDSEDLESECECTVEATVLACEKPDSLVAHTTKSLPKLEMTTSLAKITCRHSVRHSSAKKLRQPTEKSKGSRFYTTGSVYPVQSY